MRRMSPETRHRIFSAVPVWLWPYLWLQLWGLQRWIRASGRGLLIAVCPRTGKVYVTVMADAPAPEGTYAYTPPKQFAWQRLACTDAPCSPVLLSCIIGALFVHPEGMAPARIPPAFDTS